MTDKRDLAEEAYAVAADVRCPWDDIETGNTRCPNTLPCPVHTEKGPKDCPNWFREHVEQMVFGNPKAPEVRIHARIPHLDEWEAGAIFVAVVKRLLALGKDIDDLAGMLGMLAADDARQRRG